MKRYDLRTLTAEYPNLSPTPPWALLDDEYGDGPPAELPPPLSARFDWLRVGLLAALAALLLLAGRWGGGAR